MPDLHAINIHLQERLEREWRAEVRAPEAAAWLDRAGLLRNDRNGLPLRRLLRAGRIAGQEQRPDRNNGAWWIRRIAETPDRDGIFRARQRIRDYLPFERGHLHADWPLSRENPAFWQELGKTVAMFGDLENTLVSACYGLTKPPADPAAIRPEQVPAWLEWYAGVEAIRTDAMRVLSDRFIKLLGKDGHVPHAVRVQLRARLDGLIPWRNALCHGVWFGFSGDGAAVLSHLYRDGDLVMQFPARVTVEELARLRARTVDAVVRVSEAAAVAGSSLRRCRRPAAQIRTPQRAARRRIGPSLSLYRPRRPRRRSLAALHRDRACCGRAPGGVEST